MSLLATKTANAPPVGAAKIVTKTEPVLAGQAALELGTMASMGKLEVVVEEPVADEEALEGSHRPVRMLPERTVAVVDVADRSSHLLDSRLRTQLMVAACRRCMSLQMLGPGIQPSDLEALSAYLPGQPKPQQP